METVRSHLNSLKQHIHAVVKTCNANLVIYKDYEEVQSEAHLKKQVYGMHVQ